MRIGYAKNGRAWNLNSANWSTVGGDSDVYHLLKRLALRNPQHEFVLIGRNSGERPSDVGLPPNVTNPWLEFDQPKYVATDDVFTGQLKLLSDYDDLMTPIFDTFGAIIEWSAQHGTVNQPIPNVGKTWDDKPYVKAHVSYLRYCGFLTRAVNHWRDADDGQREEVWLIADPRNYVKNRDNKWPWRHPHLAQYNWSRLNKFERFRDPRQPEELGFTATWCDPTSWQTESHLIYSGLEFTTVKSPDDVKCNYDPSGRKLFGMIANENRNYGYNPAWSRLFILQNWVLPNWPDCEIYGSWTDESLVKLGRQVKPIPYDQMYERMMQWRCTLTMPASGSGWATGKFWECAAQGVVCFMHPKYDDQNHMIPPGPLRDWLRPDSPERLKKHVDACRDDDTWLWLVTEQRKLFEQRAAECQVERMIEERL